MFTADHGMSSEVRTVMVIRDVRRRRWWSGVRGWPPRAWRERTSILRVVLGVRTLPRPRASGVYWTPRGATLIRQTLRRLAHRCWALPRRRKTLGCSRFRILIRTIESFDRARLWPTPLSSWRCIVARLPSSLRRRSSRFSPGGLKPYAPLANADLQLASVEAARDAGEHARAITLAQALSRECVDGVNYLHLYDRGLLTGVVAACFLGWVGYLGAELASQGGEVVAKSTVADAMAAMVVCVVCAVLVARRSPVTYFAYFNLPVFFARRCFAAIGTTRAALATTPAKTRLPKSGKATPKGSSTTWTRRVVAASAGVGVTQLLCQSFHEREVYSGLFASASAALAVLAAGIRGRGRGRGTGLVVRREPPLRRPRPERRLGRL